MSQSNCTETTGTMTRAGVGFEGTDRINPLGLGPPFENGHVTHLDLAAVHSRGGPSFNGGGSHAHPHVHHDIGGGGFLSSSLSAAALNASSCAVPMMDMSAGSRGGGGPPLAHSSSLGWSSNGSNTISGRGGATSGLRYQHQEECPHYNSFKEAPT